MYSVISNNNASWYSNTNNASVASENNVNIASLEPQILPGTDNIICEDYIDENISLHPEDSITNLVAAAGRIGELLNISQNVLDAEKEILQYAKIVISKLQEKGADVSELQESLKAHVENNADSLSRIFVIAIELLMKHLRHVKVNREGLFALAKLLNEFSEFAELLNETTQDRIIASLIMSTNIMSTYDKNPEVPVIEKTGKNTGKKIRVQEVPTTGGAPVHVHVGFGALDGAGPVVAGVTENGEAIVARRESEPVKAPEEMLAPIAKNLEEIGTRAATIVDELENAYHAQTAAGTNDTQVRDRFTNLRENISLALRYIREGVVNGSLSLFRHSGRILLYVFECMKSLLEMLKNAGINFGPSIYNFLKESISKIFDILRTILKFTFKTAIPTVGRAIRHTVMEGVPMVFRGVETLAGWTVEGIKGVYRGVVRVGDAVNHAILTTGNTVGNASKRGAQTVSSWFSRNTTEEAPPPNRRPPPAAEPGFFERIFQGQQTAADPQPTPEEPGLLNRLFGRNATPENATRPVDHYGNPMPPGTGWKIRQRDASTEIRRRIEAAELTGEEPIIPYGWQKGEWYKPGIRGGARRTKKRHTKKRHTRKHK